MPPAQQQQQQPSSSKRAESPPYTTSETNQSLEEYQQNFWQRQMAKVEEQVSLPEEGEGSSSTTTATGGKDLMDLFKPQAGQLPLARIKKVMKASDDQVKMISAEAPILFARACEIFIADLTSRAYIHAKSHRRRTVQRSDVVAAVAGSNQFDFLVDIVPRGSEEGGKAGGGGGGSSKNDSGHKGGEEDEGDGYAEGDGDLDEEDGDSDDRESD